MRISRKASRSHFGARRYDDRARRRSGEFIREDSIRPRRGRLAFRRFERPFPEEIHRVLASKAARWHFSPTEIARDNLLREGIDHKSIHVVGNTVIDALRFFENRSVALPVRPATKRFLLVTAHRRENQGIPLKRICRAIAALVDRNRELSIVWPVHPNPIVRDVIHANLARRERIHLIEPVDYGEFLALLRASSLVVSDSGGVQEEAPAFGKPVVVLRKWNGTSRGSGVWVFGIGRLEPEKDRGDGGAAFARVGGRSRRLSAVQPFGGRSRGGANRSNLGGIRPSDLPQCAEATGAPIGKAPSGGEGSGKCFSTNRSFIQPIA